MNASQVCNLSGAGKCLNTADSPCSRSGWRCWLIQLPLCCYPHPAVGLKHDCKLLSPRVLRQRRCSSDAVPHPSATGMQLQQKNSTQAATGGKELGRRADLHRLFYLKQTRADQSSKPCCLLPFVRTKRWSHQLDRQIKDKVLASSPGIPALGQAAFSALFGLGLNVEGNGS